MPEGIIKYKKQKTLQALKDFAKYFDFVISSSKTEKACENINGVTIIPADSAIQTSGITKIFTGKNINAKELRKSVWQRRK